MLGTSILWFFLLAQASDRGSWVPTPDCSAVVSEPCECVEPLNGSTKPAQHKTDGAVPRGQAWGWTSAAPVGTIITRAPWRWGM